MALDKQPSPTNGTATVTFRIPAEAGAERAELLGEFNNWSPAPMQRLADGGHYVAVELESGQSYRFRYLLDGRRWENDWHADAYVPNEYGGDDSVIDLVAIDHDGAEAIVLDATPASTPKRSRRKTPEKSS